MYPSQATASSQFFVNFFLFCLLWGCKRENWGKEEDSTHPFLPLSLSLSIPFPLQVATFFLFLLFSCNYNYWSTVYFLLLWFFCLFCAFELDVCNLLTFFSFLNALCIMRCWQSLIHSFSKPEVALRPIILFGSYFLFLFLY